jgi:hypothetical protein
MNEVNQSPEENLAQSIVEACGGYYNRRLSEEVKVGIQRSKKAKTPSLEAQRSIATN